MAELSSDGPGCSGCSSRVGAQSVDTVNNAATIATAAPGLDLLDDLQ